MRVLLTGGAGYIGAHLAVVLAEVGHDVAIVDDLSASHAVVIDRVRALAGRDIPFLAADVRDEDAVAGFVSRIGGADAAVHLAGLKSVAESVADPARYYDANVGGAAALVRTVQRTGIGTIVFSSSATVYAPDNAMPVGEDASTGFGQASPYGTSKRVVEQLLADVAASVSDLRVVSLRYFNPVGAHPSGVIGEDPLGEPQNLMPVVARVAARVRSRLAVNGRDYDTPDGTTQRDYIHVLDLADGHVAALQNAPAGASVFNLGTGVPVSVLELVSAFQEASGEPVPYVFAPRRPGDLAVSYADPSRAARALGWTATRTIGEACADYWRWQRANPRGYGG